MRYSFFLLFLVLLSGCTKVGPNYHKDEIVTIPQQLQQENNISTEELASWWEIFHDETLNTLIETGYKNNLDLKQAGLRILQARALLGVSQGLQYPQVQTLSGNALISRQSNQTINSAGINFDLGWEIDFWGKYARGIESATANLYLSVASYEDIMRSLTAEIARNYINYRIAQERIIYAKRNIAIQERVTQMTQIQFNSGNVSELDMQQAKTQLYTTKAKLPALKLSRENALNALALLVALPKEKLQEMIPSKEIHPLSDYVQTTNHTITLKENAQNSYDPHIIPTALLEPTTKINIAVLKHRPDIQVAEYKAQAASAKIGATKALLYPSFTLFGTIGINANDATGEWTSFEDAFGVSAGPSFQWNIFQYGRIKNQIRFENARFEEAMLGYNKALLQAINEVTNAIDGYMYTKEQLKENKLALMATTRAFNLSAQQYNDGLVSYQRLLSTVEKLTLTQDLYAQIKGSLSIQAVLLYKALGGGWNTNRAYIDEHTQQRLQESGVDWGEYLDDVSIDDE